MPTVRVQGESYRSSDELLDAISELEQARDNSPEYGPQRRSIESHLNALQRALRSLKEGEAATQERETGRRERQLASGRKQKERAGAVASDKRRRQARSFLSGSRRDVSRAADATGVSEPIGSVGDLALQVIGWTILVSLAYALINPSGRGPATVAAAAKGSSGFLGRLLDPSQPLVHFTAGKTSAQTSGDGSGSATSSSPAASGTGGFNALTQAVTTAGARLIGSPNVPRSTHDPNVAPNNWESDNADDFGVKVGTPVYAVAAGKIGSAFGSLGTSGRFAGLRLHLVAASNEFYYAHLSRYAPGIKPGVTVRRGQLLGYTGSANGVAHLHFASKLGNPGSWAKWLGL